MVGDGRIVEAVHLLPHAVVEDHAALVRLYDSFIAPGFEGMVLRHPNGPYRFGKATDRDLLAVMIKLPEASARRFKHVWAKRKS